MDSMIIFGAKYLFIFVPVLVVWALYQANYKDRRAILASLIIAVVLAAIFDKIASKLYYDPRPFTTHSFKPLISHSADNGFPSEHTLFSVTLAAVIYFYRHKLGAVALVIALLVGAARVAALVHSPIDIFGGLVLGIFAARFGFILTRKYLKTEHTRPSRHPHSS